MSENGRTKAIKAAGRFIAEIDQAELAIRLIERGCHMRRPMGLSGHDAWKQFEKSAAAGEVPEYIIRDFEAMAHIAIAYFSECIEKLQKPN